MIIKKSRLNKTLCASTNRKLSVHNKLVLVASYLLMLATLVHSQTDRSPVRGFQAGNSYSISEIENVNLSNGNLMMHIPLASLPNSRGDLGYTVSLQYNGKLWNSYQARMTDGSPDQNNNTSYLRELLGPADNGGWRINAVGYALNIKNRMDLEAEAQCIAGNEYEYARNGYAYRLEMEMPDGQVVEFRPYGTGPSYTDMNNDGWFSIDQNGLRHMYSLGTLGPDGIPGCTYSTSQITTAGMTYYSSDNSGIRLFVPYNDNNRWKMYLPNGTLVENAPADDTSLVQRVTDRNGNHLLWQSATVNGIAGVKIVNDVGQYVFVSNYSNSANEIIRQGTGGSELATTIHWKEYNVARKYKTTSAFNANPVYRYEDTSWQFTFVDKITLPTQAGSLEYNFTYNASENVPDPGVHTVGWGELTSVSLPSGASATYGYGFTEPDATLINSAFVVNRRVNDRTLTYLAEYDGSSSQVSEVTSYALNTVSGPDGSTHAEYAPTSTTFPGYNCRTVNPNGSITEKIWATNLAPGVNGLAVNSYVKTEFTSIPDAAGNPTLTATRDFDYDKNGNVLETREYDWVPYSSVPRTGTGTNQKPTGLPSGLILKRKTINTYYYPTPIATDSATNSANLYASPSAPKLRNLIKSTEVQDGSGVPRSRTEFYYDGGANSPDKGNLTETRVWDSSKGAYGNPLTAGVNSISTFTAYNSFGSPISTTDANGAVTHIFYGNVTGPNGVLTDLYPTQTIIADGTPLARTSAAVYDFYTGLVTTMTDADNNVSTVTTYDDLGRPTKVATATGTALESWVQTTYHDGDSTDSRQYVVVKSDTDTRGDGRKVATQFFDQLGRVRLVKTLEDAATQSATNETDGIKIQTRYLTDYDSTSGVGHTYQLTSNPYRASTSSGAPGEPTMGWTLSTAPNTGRHSEVQTFSGAGLPTAFGGSNASSTGTVTTDLDANRTLVTDQAGIQRINRANTLGQLTDVWEIAPSDGATVAVTFPNTSIASGYQTSYSYDPLNNLTTVSQGVQTRTFTYSSLSRLLSAANPESGTISYAYDSNGNLTSKIDARSVTTTNAYDALNRITSRSYSDSTPVVEYTYDNVTNAKGRLTRVASSVSTTEYTAFDILGRVTAARQITSGGDAGGYTTGYSYTLAGSLDTETYPSGRVVKNELNDDGSLSIVESKKDAGRGFWTYANSFTYNPAGAVTSMQLGNGKWESTVFNSRLQPTQIALGTVQSGYELLKLNYTYNTAGNADNNGNVLSQTITVPTVGANTGFMAVQTYNYDGLNRLKDATEYVTPTGGASSQSWKQAFTYDRYGNRNFDEVNTTTLPKNCGSSPNFLVCASDKKVVDPTVDPSNNRPRTSDSYSFDNAGNMTADPQSRTFVYDGENKQVSVSNGSDTIGQYWYDGDGKRVKKYVSSTGATTVFVYDAVGKLIAEYSTIVASAEDAKVSYLTADHLGSPRINTDQNGAIIARHDYMPFGEEIDGTGGRTTGLNYGDDSVSKQFTGYERDKETDLDFAQARVYSSHLARFLSVDPIFTTLQRLIDPQRLNLYEYARNRPYTFFDPSGLDTVLSAKDQAEAEKQFELALKGLRKDDRQFVHLKVGDGKDGYKKGRFYVVVDKDAKSDSKNFQALQTISNDRDRTTTISFVKQGDTYSLYAGVEEKGKAGFQKKTDHLGIVKLTNFDDDPGAPVYGSTLFAKSGEPIVGGEYSTSGENEVRVWSEQTDIEQVSTLFHELRGHVFLSNNGRNPLNGMHRTPGVTKETKAAEAEAKANFQQE